MQRTRRRLETNVLGKSTIYILADMADSVSSRVLHNDSDEFPQQGIGHFQYVSRDADSIRGVYNVRYLRFGDFIQGVGAIESL